MNSIKLRQSLRLKILIVLVTIILIVMMFPKGESIESEVTVGSVWIQNDLIASTTFEVLKSSDFYEKEKMQAAQRVQPIFLRDNSITSVTIDSLKKYNVIIPRILSFRLTSEEEINKTFLSDNSFNVFLRFKKQATSFKDVKTFSLTEVLRLARDLLDRIYQRGLLNLSYNEINRDSIAVRDGRFERVFAKTLYLDRESANNYISNFLFINIGSNRELNEAVTEYVLFFLKPNIIYSYELTDSAIRNAKEKVPRNIGIVNENERIVAKHDRITNDIKLKIDSYKIAKGEEIGFWARFAQNLGKFFHILIILLLLIIYINLFRKRIYNDNLKILLISIIILFISFITYLVYNLNASAPVELLVILPVASMLLTIIFDSRVGFYGTVTIAMIVGGLRGNDYVFALMNIVAGGLAAYTVRDIKNRTQIFRSFFYILVGYFVSIIAFSLERFASFDQMLISFAFASSNALISPVFTYGLIIFIEKIFKITTDLTLLELTDFNHPLLKDLAHKAPGTFNHSMIIGTLVETTAEAIGASPILARVGAYYHDIGKSIDPDSFVENQLKSENIHEGLKPEQSVELIKNHVIKGIDLAKKSGLPQEIIDFIPMHHGTMVISYFCEKAKLLYGEDNIDVNQYRYPGPKPDTKETALVMLADACESTIRSLVESDRQKVENIINNLISARIEDGQLDNAPLTFKDISKIRESFLKILIGQHHKRIRYPNQEDLETTRDDK
ncbi:MAG: HDIG domain-containing protein [Melioribacteraceae bacterium]|nr:HDIG domain-containing protein [Melioribacteraceae bacterium]